VRTGELGYWWRSLGGPPARRPPLAGSTEADVVIVGAGYTGLWTAYYLKRAEPSLRIVVLEREMAGFGASGRNGGWVTGFFSGPPRLYEGRGGRDGLAALQRAMFATVDEVGRVLEQQRIDADFVKGGQVRVALNRAQALRLRELVNRSRELGLGERDLRALDTAELEQRMRVAGARCATFSPHAARVHPGKLLSGLAGAVQELGVRIHEGTPVTEVRPHEALTPVGHVRARWVVRATEGYTAGLRGLGRALAPISSSMIITAPLGRSAWRQIGWEGGEVLGDGAHAYVYLQRTDDGRIAIGGRGVPYRFGSRTCGDGDTARATVASLHERLLAMFPAAAGVEIDHAWSGVLGVSRDWGMSVEAQPGSGLAWAGGYVGQGVAAANLAGRTLRDLLLGRRSSLTDMPWVGRRPRRWEPEPLRWAGIRAAYALYRGADRRERRSASPSRLARWVDAATGRR
jgi:glycine/D-amino acid oxidase-like deaminating enzyme